MLTALCVALPAQVGLIVIGGEGALALGGLSESVATLGSRRNALVYRLAVDGGLGHARGRHVDRRSRCDAAASAA